MRSSTNANLSAAALQSVPASSAALLHPLPGWSGAANCRLCGGDGRSTLLPAGGVGLTGGLAADKVAGATLIALACGRCTRALWWPEGLEAHGAIGVCPELRRGQRCRARRSRPFATPG